MRALSVDATTKEIKEIDIEIQANSVYTFFNSISIDEFSILKEHMIYADANALSYLQTSQNKNFPIHLIVFQLLI